METALVSWGCAATGPQQSAVERQPDEVQGEDLTAAEARCAALDPWNPAWLPLSCIDASFSLLTRAASVAQVECDGTG